ncbi:hypothetical protein O6H91_Y167400 [Diphasiastrum complanatum]|nr:hypothetical protein O6H91_Y167400 [Diphasiastrum complanatum]
MFQAYLFWKVACLNICLCYVIENRAYQDEEMEALHSIYGEDCNIHKEDHSFEMAGLPDPVNRKVLRCSSLMTYYFCTDWILPDLNIQTTLQLNHGLKTNANRYYFSYATKRTTKLFGQTVPSSLSNIHPILLIRA